MRKYGTITPMFWTRGSGRELRGDAPAQVLALYLMTCPASSMCGIYYLPSIIMAHETGLPHDVVTRSLERLATLDIAHHDPLADMVWVPGLAHWQIGPELKVSDNRRWPLLEELDKVGKHPFLDAFYERYSDSYHLSDTTRRKQQAKGRSGAKPDGGVQLPLTPPLPPGVDKGFSRMRAHALQDQEQDQEQDQDRAPPGPLPGNRRGRAPRTVIPADWQPTADLAADVRAKNLDLDAVVSDFVGFWRNDGKLGADWNAAFRNNIAKIMRTDYLRDRFTLPEPAKPIGPRPHTNLHGPPAAPPIDLVGRMRELADQQKPKLLRDDGKFDADAELTRLHRRRVDAAKASLAGGQPDDGPAVARNATANVVPEPGQHKTAGKG